VPAIACADDSEFNLARAIRAGVFRKRVKVADFGGSKSRGKPLPVHE
jgi:hypothetical protein